MDSTQAHDFCAALPGATLDDKWRFEDSVHPTFCVGGRMFAMFSRKQGTLTDGLLFKADDDRFLELTDREGFRASPYLARAKWVTLDTTQRLPDDELKALLTVAHAVVVAKLSRKKQAEILGGAIATDAAARTSAAKKTSRGASVGARASATMSPVADAPSLRRVATRAAPSARKSLAKRTAR